MKKIMNYRFFIVLLFFVASTHYTQAPRKGDYVSWTDAQKAAHRERNNKWYAGLSPEQKDAKKTNDHKRYAARQAANGKKVRQYQPRQQKSNPTVEVSSSSLVETNQKRLKQTPQSNPNIAPLAAAAVITQNTLGPLSPSTLKLPDPYEDFNFDSETYSNSSEDTDNDNDKKILEGYDPDEDVIFLNHTPQYDSDDSVSRNLLGKRGRYSDPKQPNPIVSISTPQIIGRDFCDVAKMLDSDNDSDESEPDKPRQNSNQNSEAPIATISAPHTLSSQQPTFPIQPLVSGATISSQKGLLQPLCPAVDSAAFKAQDTSINNAPKTSLEKLIHQRQALLGKPNSNPYSIPCLDEQIASERKKAAKTPHTISRITSNGDSDNSTLGKRKRTDENPQAPTTNAPAPHTSSNLQLPFATQRLVSGPRSNPLQFSTVAAAVGKRPLGDQSAIKESQRALLDLGNQYLVDFNKFLATTSLPEMQELIAKFPASANDKSLSGEEQAFWQKRLKW